MSRMSNIKRQTIAIGFAAFAGTFATSNAFAFGGFGGGFGGGHQGSMGGGGFGGGRMGGGGGFGGGHGPMGRGHGPMGESHGPTSGGHGPMGGGSHWPQTGMNGGSTAPSKIECFHAPCGIGGNGSKDPHWPHPGPHWPQTGDSKWPHPGPHWPQTADNWPKYPGKNCWGTHSCGPRPVSCRWYHYASFCHWRPYYPAVIETRQPIYTPTPLYTQRVVYGSAPAPSYRAPTAAYSATAPATYTPPAPAVCVKNGTYISVVFQPTATAADITAFLKSYNVTMDDGPNNDGVYWVRVPEGSVPSDQYGQMIDSMRGQTNIVSSISG